MARVSYDEENDILLIHEGFKTDERFKGNLDAGDVILDISTQHRVRGVEILNATKFFKDVFKEFNTEDILKNIVHAKISSSIKPSGIVVGLSIKSKNIEKEFPAKLIVPLGKLIYS